VLAETRLEPEPSFQIAPHNLELNQTIESLAGHGVKVEMTAASDTAVVLISAEQRDGPATGSDSIISTCSRATTPARATPCGARAGTTLAQRMHDAAP